MLSFLYQYFLQKRIYLKAISGWKHCSLVKHHYLRLPGLPAFLEAPTNGVREKPTGVSPLGVSCMKTALTWKIILASQLHWYQVTPRPWNVMSVREAYGCFACRLPPFARKFVVLPMVLKIQTYYSWKSSANKLILFLKWQICWSTFFMPRK